MHSPLLHLQLLTQSYAFVDAWSSLERDAVAGTERSNEMVTTGAYGMGGWAVYLSSAWSWIIVAGLFVWAHCLFHLQEHQIL